MASRSGAAAVALFGVAALSAVAGHLIGNRALDTRDEWPDVADRVTLPSPDNAPLMWAGYRELGASLTWCRGLVYYGGGGQDVADYRYLTQFIDNIIALDPWFKPVYRWAAYAVTFQERQATPEEYELSVRYLELAAERFPDDYEYPWLAGLRYWLDLRADDPNQRRKYQEIGADYIESAMHKPDAPEDLATLAATFRTKLGQRERAIADLEQQIMLASSQEHKERMLRHLGYLTQDASLVDELRAKANEFHEKWMASYPYLPATMFVLLGERPDKTFRMDDLANERDLFGADFIGTGEPIDLYDPSAPVTPGEDAGP